MSSNPPITTSAPSVARETRESAPTSKSEEKRAGAALVRATKPYAEEIPALSWFHLLSTAAVHGAVLAVILLAPWPAVQLAGSVLLGLVTVRLFIIYHDALHGAIFRDSPLGSAAMVAIGWLTLSPPPIWRESHDYHHRNNAKMTGAAIGSYPVVTTRIWRIMTPTQRRWYRFARSPWTILFGYFTIFLGGMVASSFVRDPKRHWQNPLAVLAHLVAMGLVGWYLGPFTAFAAVFLPMFIACALGSYLFYAQHNFPDARMRDRRKWTYHFAALHSSSMFDMSPIMHWFTGNIGYHHVHHLNHKIPFYRLPEAMAAMPQLQQPGRTTWRPSDVAACLRLKLWDPEQERMVGWDAVS